MPFPRIYSDESCPLDGYAGYTFRVLLNPTGAEKMDWAMGHLGIEGCEACARLGTARGKQGSSGKRYCTPCQEARERMGRSASAIFGTSHTDGFDFSTPDTALATFEQPDLPDELLAWLYMLPTSLWAARSESLKKTLSTLLTTPS